MASKASKAFYKLLYKNLIEEGLFIPKESVSSVYQALCKTCREYILNGETFTLFGVGVFRLTKKNGKVRNRITGRIHDYQYHYIVFQAAKTLKEEIRVLSQTIWKNEQELKEEKVGYGENSD